MHSEKSLTYPESIDTYIFIWSTIFLHPSLVVFPLSYPFSRLLPCLFTLDLCPPLASVLTIPLSTFGTFSLFSTHVFFMFILPPSLFILRSPGNHPSVSVFAIRYLQKFLGEKWFVYVLSVNQSSDDDNKSMMLEMLL